MIPSRRRTDETCKRREDYVKILDKSLCKDNLPQDPTSTVVYRTWCYLVEWSDGTASWVPVRELKRSGKEGKELARSYEESVAV